MGEIEAKFGKSRENIKIENAGLKYLLADPRMQAVDLDTKIEILRLVRAEGNFGPQTFDAVMTPVPMPQLNASNVESVFPELRLVEMKTTRKPIKDARLSGFFFGATEREYELATLLGDRFVFAFVVLNSHNEYGHPFAVLLPLSEVARRTRSRRTQFQVTLRTDITDLYLHEAGILLDHPPPAEPGT